MCRRPSLRFSAVTRIVSTAMLREYAASKAVPFPELAVVAAGVLILVGGFNVLLGLWPQAHELHVGSRVISHWNEDQPLHVTIPEDHLPSSARIQTSQATGLSYSPPHA